LNTNLLNHSSFYLFTFSATSQALKAEKVLKSFQADFLLIPTLREISASCGLSVRLAPENLKQYFHELVENGVSVEGVYHVEKEGKQNQIQKIES
jgi:hypothetical protein